jgi:hypothetical protein
VRVRALIHARRLQVGAGTNNSRIAGLLRTLSTFYKTEADHLFTVRLAQGLLHMGKGLMTISPFHSDRLLLAPTALGTWRCRFALRLCSACGCGVCARARVP